MDVHRCRFVPFPASPINAVAFSHPLLSAKRQEARLAIGRANGDIEIWNPLKGSWFHETTIHGGSNRSVDALVWVTGEDETLPDGNVILGKSRLFSIGYTSTITEWDLEKGKAKKHASDGQHGDIWCFAAQPAPTKESHNGITSVSQPQRLVAGTVDGSIALYSIDDDDLHFQRLLVKTAKKNIKMVSIAFQSRQVAVVGCSDSSIRVYDLRRGELLRKMTLGKDLTGGSKEIIVWSVKCLKNGDIVSGDSTGQICIWDGKTYTQAQRIQGHKSDVLSLATGADGQTIVSGGMDRRTAMYRPIKSDPSRWQKVFHKKYHKHDVKTMASFEGLGMSVVVTAGPDATPIVTPLRQAGVENHRALPHLPQSVPLQTASSTRLLVSWWDREIHFWKVLRSHTGPADSLKQKKDFPQIGRILIQGEANITSCSISRDGSILVVSTATAIKAFHLTIPNLDLGEQLKIRKMSIPSIIENAGAAQVQISPEGQWLAWTEEGSQVRIAKITLEDSGFSIQQHPAKLTRLRRDIPKHVRLGGLGNYERHITHITFSPDSKILATADLAGYVDTWTLREDGVQNGAASAEDDSASSSDEEDASQSGPSWVRNPKASLIPKLAHAPVALSFSDDILAPILRDEGEEGPDDYILLAVTATSRIYTFNPLEGSLTKWSRRNAVWKLPEEIRATRDLIKGVVWAGSRIWMYGVSFVFMIDLSSDFAEQEPGASKKNRKRKRGADSGAGSKTETGTLAPQPVRTLVAGDNKESQWVDVEMADAEPQADGTGDEDENDDAEEEAAGGELEKLRKQEQAGRSEGEEVSPPGAEEQRKSWWHTYKYRPILGIAPLQNVGGRDRANGVNGSSKKVGIQKVEVVLIERPKEDIAMPERYVED
ncbi:hypothetical protein KVR01_007024 [Diaporthe batatas]|uniref:uncharacterized protein n=1 Tax=Diaporthe batatas TaxID=748121 RepID=UPI001D039199|nr:uncharacterized protein KVR01_007024 [Diaporthe batatas]KAG8163727.1 hypothetical protein KVR01_007024 [Diaporthe batatas]